MLQLAERGTLDWATLERHIPGDRVSDDGHLHHEVIELFDDGRSGVTASLPGKHWPETDPPGGDFRIGVTSRAAGWDDEGFSYRRFFDDLASKSNRADAETRIELIRTLYAICSGGEDPASSFNGYDDLPGVEWPAFLVATQALALQEHRRYRELEGDRGGRHLLPEFAFGLILDIWTAEEATLYVVQGPLGLRVLREETQHRGIIGSLVNYIDNLDRIAPARSKDRPAALDDAARASKRDRALQLLRSMAGDSQANFRPQQWEAIEKAVLDRHNVLLVQRTGWGKSAVYMIATKLLREDGQGPALLISPLLSLMRNQVEMAARAGIRADTLNHANASDHDQILDDIASGRLDLLLVSPEWSTKPDFYSKVLGILEDHRPSLLVVDEAHCITDWGHDFRPDYRRIGELLDVVPEGTPVIAATATATQRVRNDIQLQFGTEFIPFVGDLARPGLRLRVQASSDRPTRLATILDVANRHEGTGIVYCLTKYDTRQVADWLSEQGIGAVAYHADIENREEIERKLLDNDVKVVAATTALGMGFDKPDLAFVIHYQSPPSVVAYYQQVGRAGRGISQAEGVLMHAPEDAIIHGHFIKSAFPEPDELLAVYNAVPETGGAWNSAIAQQANVAMERVDQILKMIAVDGAIKINQSGRWFRVAAGWSPDVERMRRISAQRIKEREAIDLYAATDSCRMQFLLHQLDDGGPERCRECDNCTGDHLAGPSSDLVASVSETLKSKPITIPRINRMPYIYGRRNYFRKEGLIEKGRALTVFPGGEYAARVMEQRDAGSFDDMLVEAAARLLNEWHPTSRPAWVAAVPSRRRPHLVPEFARALARAIDLPFIPLLKQVQVTDPQDELENETRRYFNVVNAFAPAGRCPSSPAFLIDDFVASGWTMAMAGRSLRLNGAGKIYPFALARVIFR